MTRMRIGWLALVLSLSACSQDDGLTFYRVPKEDAVPMAASPVSGTQDQSVTWTVPSSWKQQPASGMRVASFGLPGAAEVSIVALPGDAGGDLANVNRWRGQLGLAPISSLEGNSRTMASPAGEVLVVSFASPKKGGMVGARLLAGGQTWFFKLTGSEQAIKSSASDFSHFLASLRPGASAPAAEMPSQSDASSSLAWKLPSGWKQEAGSGMRVATLRAPSAAEVSVVSLPGDAGGDLANVNRWRDQLGLGPVSSLDGNSNTIKSPAGEVLVVDISSPGKGRMIGARLSARGQSWFFKLTGKDGAIASAKPAFNGFLGSLRLDAQ